MRASHEIRVPVELLAAEGLTHMDKLVWIAVRSRQGNNPTCYASHGTLADDIGSGRSAVNRAVNRLRDKGWIVGEGRHLSCAVPAADCAKKAQDCAELAHLAEDANCAELAQKCAKKAQGCAKKAQRTESQQLKPKGKTKRKRSAREDADRVDVADGSPKPAAKPKPLPLPEWIDRAAWDGYVEMRRAKGKRGAMTGRARELTLAKLAALRDNGHDPNDVLDQSTQREWVGVFPLKSDFQPRFTDASTTRKHPNTGGPGAGRDPQADYERSLRLAAAAIGVGPGGMGAPGDA